MFKWLKDMIEDIIMTPVLLLAVLVVFGVVGLLTYSGIKSIEKVREPSKSEQLFSGTHELRKFKVITETGTKWSSSYFLVAGSASGKTVSDTRVSFSWKLNNGMYAISELPLSKIRVMINDSIQKPYVKFRWGGMMFNTNQIEDYMNHDVIYMVVYCKESDFPMEININQL
jgi:hypothetical protein